jgi:hypothetical protein
MMDLLPVACTGVAYVCLSALIVFWSLRYPPK